MADPREQRVCIKFCFKLGKTASETHQMLKQAFGDNSLGQTQTYDWYKRFKTGQTSTDGDDRSGRPSNGTTPENVAKVRVLSLQDRRLIIQDLCNTFELSYGTCQRILSEKLNMRRTAAKFVSRLLQNEQNGTQTTGHSMTTHDRIRLNIVQEFLAKNKMAVVPHPPYSPDLTPCDFLLFPKMKIKLKGRRFDTVEEIQAETQTVLNTLTKKDFQDAFEKWQKRWDRCMRSQGDYFEGDGAE
ncbi:hypothetical protein B7P43_G00693 [Cryptotermes secundus]|uniref:Mos1 transposase HTH domain-containing protein n=1 Tax=Cryptotermes secundus TaxID=105785 RepID=A0A2J7RS22_9NEOP|nr:hypothetical protein B7P43_G00693 [Cryptotermes secundus]